MHAQHAAFVAPGADSRHPVSGVERARARLADAIAKLVVWHRPGVADGGSSLEPAFGVLRIRTCQREVRLSLSTAPSTVDPRAEIRRGIDAYRFLLRFATGLESAIPGEANVFGQVRDAWRAFEREHPDGARALAPLADAWFRDARGVRARFLQGIGGQSYATLTRRLLGTTAASRVLVVGAGALGRSMLQKFGANEVAVFNRTRLTEVPENVRVTFGPGEEPAAVAWATHVVMCVPRTPEIDDRWLPLLRARAGLRIVHLACRRDDAGDWRDLATLIDLDHVFDLQRRQGELRTRQLAGAHAACATLAERAVSRALL
jgi:glutamyl-tRNA reductase